MSEVSSEFKNQCRAAALLMIVFRIEHSTKDYTVSEIHSYLEGLKPTRLVDFTVDFGFLEYVLNNLWFRNKIKFLFPSVVDFVCSTKHKYNVKFNTHHKTTQTPTELMDAVKKLQDKFLTYPPPAPKKSDIRLRSGLSLKKIEKRQQEEEIESSSEEEVEEETIESLKLKLLESEERLAKAEAMLIEADDSLKRLKKSRRYFKNKNFRQANDELDISEASLGSELVALLRKAKAFRITDAKNKNHISMVAAALIADIVSTCNVSAEKVPLVLTDALFMWFGPLPLSIIREFVIGDKAVTICMDQAADADREHTKLLLNSADDSERVECLTLLTDESNKMNKNLKIKLGIAKMPAGPIVQRAFNTDNVFSKKTKESAAQTIESLEKEVGFSGMISITSACCDWFAEGKELSIVLAYVDEIIVQYINSNPEARKRLLIISKLDPTLIYNWAVKFREDRIHACEAHNLDRVFNPLVSFLSGEAGLKFDLTLAQNLYRLMYYTSNKFLTQFRTILNLYFKELVGDELIILPIPPILWNKFGNTALNRWLSATKQALKLVSMLSIVAPAYMVAKAKTMFTNNKPEMESEWEEVLYGAQSIIDPTKSSAYIMATIILSCKVPAGKTGEAKKNLLLMVGFLGSTNMRINILVLSGLYQIHKNWLSFVNKPSKVVPMSKVIGNRVIESTVFNRNVVATVAMLSSNWPEVIPDIYSAIKLSAERSREESPAGCINFWTEKVQEHAKLMLPFAMKYFVNMDLKLGWAVNLMVDPIVGPAFCRGALNAFRKLNLISPTAAAHGYLPIIGCAPPPCEFKIDCPIFAYPGITFDELTQLIEASYLENPARTEAIAAAYGLLHPEVLNEIKLLAQSKLKTELLPTGWKPGAYVKTYFATVFKPKFPYVADLLLMNFSATMIANTPSEIGFSISRNQARANNSASTTTNRMNHALNVRGTLVSDMRYSNNKGPRRPMRSHHSRHEYTNLVVKTARKYKKNYVDFSKDVRKRLKVAQKRKAEFDDGAKYAMAEMEANFKRGGFNNGFNIKDMIKVFDISKKSGEFAIPALTGDAGLNEKVGKTPKKVIIAILTKYYPDKTLPANKKVSKHAAAGASSLNELLFRLWKVCPDAKSDDNEDVIKQNLLDLDLHDDDNDNNDDNENNADDSDDDIDD